MSARRDPSLSTKAIHAGTTPDPHTGAVVPSISLSSTFVQSSPHVLFPGGFDYARSGNPNRRDVEHAVAACEGGVFGLAFSSGCAALSTVVQSLPSGSKIVTGYDIYGGTNRYFHRVAVPQGYNVVFVDTGDVDAVQKVMDGASMLWIETPSNPTLTVFDIASLSTLAHAANPKCMVVVDNTFLSPFNQSPLSLGADVVMHSVSKFLSGHSDVVMGMLVTSNADLAQRLRFLQNAVGAVPSPFDCWLAHRGLRTLAVRMDRHNQNALHLALFLSRHPKVSKVSYPGLPSHPQHALAKRQQSGFGGVLSFWLDGGLDDVRLFFENIKGPFALAESLGGVESLLAHPATMSHASLAQEERARLGITDNLIRVSVGIESFVDLERDVSDALSMV